MEAPSDLCHFPGERDIYKSMPEEGRGLRTGMQELTEDQMSSCATQAVVEYMARHTRPVVVTLCMKERGGRSGAGAGAGKRLKRRRSSDICRE